MKITDEKYSKYALVREMMETSEIIRKFNPLDASRFIIRIKAKKGLFMAGEGSSRIFPAKRAIFSMLQTGNLFPFITEGSTQALDYNLSNYGVFAASNSGQTKEVIRLAMKLQKSNHDALFGLTANSGTKLEEIASDTHILSCGKENAVAATKSVMEQGLFYDSLLRNLLGKEMPELDKLAEDTSKALTLAISKDIIDSMKSADVLYFAGRNNGVAEELALKTNEITRKKSDFLEGTFAVHGIEEVMDRNEVLVWIDPFAEEEEKFHDCLVKGVGMKVFVITAGESRFPGIKIPDGGFPARFAPYRPDPCRGACGLE